MKYKDKKTQENYGILYRSYYIKQIQAWIRMVSMKYKFVKKIKSNKNKVV